MLIKKSESSLIYLLGKYLNLGIGESEAIALAHENDINVLIDDLKACKIALSLNLKVSGTIGFLLKAYRLGLINSAFEDANKLKKAGFYISEALLENIKLEESKFENR